MATTIKPLDIVMVRLEYSFAALAEETAMNVLYYQLDQLSDATSGLPSAIAAPWENIAEELADVMYAVWSTAWKGFASEDVIMKGVSVQKVRESPRSDLLHFAPAAPVQGLQLGHSLPLQDAVTILKKTGYGERWGMGRTFVPGVAEVITDNGFLIGGGVTALQPFIVQSSASVVGATDEFGFVFKPVLFDTNPESHRITPIRSATLSDPIIKTQRRRRPGKGS